MIANNGNMRGIGRNLAMLFTALATVLLVSCTTGEVLEPSSEDGTWKTAVSSTPASDDSAANGTSIQSAPAQPVQAQSAPAQPVQAQSAPAQPVQAQSAPAQPVQAQSAPAQPVQAQSASAQPVQAQSASARPTNGPAAAIAGLAKFRFAPIVGSTVEAVSPLAERMAKKARERGIGLARSDDTSATHVLKGYLSVISEGNQTTVIYVWDVLDVSGNRLHRIQGQQKEAGKGDGWAAVQPQTMQAIADVTVEQLAAWLAASRG